MEKLAPPDFGRLMTRMPTRGDIDENDNPVNGRQAHLALVLLRRAGRSRGEL